MTQPQQHQPMQPMQPNSDFIYTCNKIHNDGDEWMLADIDTHTFACKWTKRSDRAYTFSSEQEVEEMISLFPVLYGCHIGRILVGY